MGETLPLFTTSFNRSLSVESRAEHLSGDGGAIVQRELMERSGIISWLMARLEDTRCPHQVIYSLPELLRTRLLLLGQGWRDQDDADALRYDPAFRLSTSCRRSTTPLDQERHLPSQPTLSRLLDLLSSEANLQVLRESVMELTGRRLRAERRGHRPRYLTLDVDSLPIEVHGKQPGSAWNGHYRQRMYHPIIAGIAETGDLLDARLRKGSVHTADGALSFILELIDRAKTKLCQVATVRMDAGFPCEKVLGGLEERGISYVARLGSNSVLDRLAAPNMNRPEGCPPEDGGEQFHEMDYQAGPWSKARRVVLVVVERPGQLLLDRFWLITNFTQDHMPAQDLLALYRKRGAAENSFGELMDVLGPTLSSTVRTRKDTKGSSPSSPSKPEAEAETKAEVETKAEAEAFARNEALLLLNLLAYGLMHAGRRCMETATRTGWSLRRYRERVLSIGARITIHARRAILIVAQSAQHFWSLIWPAINRMAWPPP